MTEIKDVDREAALGAVCCCERCNSLMSQAFAAHREAAEKAERDRICAWFRKVGSTASHGVFLDAIERGEHLK